MSVVRHRYWWGLALVLLCFQSCLANTGEVIHIGVLAHRGKAQALNRWRATANYLHESIHKTFDIVPLDLEEMSHAVQTGSIDFVLTNLSNTRDIQKQQTKSH